MQGNSIVIFDLDGTLALNKHREHYIACPKPDWDSYFEACDKDLPNYPVIALNQLLAANNVWIEIWSGRSEAVRAKTVDWLQAHNVQYDELLMRPVRNYTNDAVLKREWLHAVADEAKSRITFIVDDRNSVVKMWRDEGMTCLQVAEGDF